MWKDNWVTFLDTMLQIQILGTEGRGLRLPTRIRSIRIDPATHTDHVVQVDSDHSGVSNLSVAIDIKMLFFMYGIMHDVEDL